MIQTRDHLRRVIRRGDAIEVGICQHDQCEYVIVDRYDLQRTDHYLANDFKTTFPDGSSIVQAGDAWDFGFTGEQCFCWEGGGHRCKKHGQPGDDD